jgi:hypothetical protein
MFQSLQVLYVSNNSATSETLREHMCTLDHYCWWERDAHRLVEERQHKWDLNAAQLIDFFSSLGVLVEVAATDSSNAYPQTLTGIGYTASTATGDNDSSSSSSSAAHALTSSGGRTWLQQVGWCCSSTGRLRAFPAARASNHTRSSNSSDSINATLVEPVVSGRLVTCKVERDAVLQCGTACTGLLCANNSTCSSSSSSSSTVFAGLMPVPCQSVVSAKDAHWLAVPGRYCVSLKLDGTRHLLIATDSGCYLLNRAGMMYKHPVAAAAIHSEHHSNNSSSDSPTQDSNSTASSGSTEYSSHKGGTACSSLRLRAGTHNDTADSTASGAASFDGATTITTGGSSSSSSSGTNILLRTDHNAAAAAADSAAAATSAAAVPAGTVLDGELLLLSTGPSGGKRGYFVVFDALSVAGIRVWQWPLQHC